MKHHIREYGIAISFLVPILQKNPQSHHVEQLQSAENITCKTKEFFYSMFYRVMTISLFSSQFSFLPASWKIFAFLNCFGLTKAIGLHLHVDTHSHGAIGSAIQNFWHSIRIALGLLFSLLEPIFACQHAEIKSCCMTSKAFCLPSPLAYQM